MNSPSRRKIQKAYSDIYAKHSIKDQLRIRELQPEDYDKGYYELMNQLADAPTLSREEFEIQLKAIKEETPIHKIIVFEDEVSGNLMASGTIFLERKFIRANALAGHIEDIVVNCHYRQSGYGKLLITVLKDVAFEAGAYKIILDCKESNMPFYEKCGFSQSGAEMKLYDEKIKRETTKKEGK